MSARQLSSSSSSVSRAVYALLQSKVTQRHAEKLFQRFPVCNKKTCTCAILKKSTKTKRSPTRRQKTKSARAQWTAKGPLDNFRHGWLACVHTRRRRRSHLRGATHEIHPARTIKGSNAQLIIAECAGKSVTCSLEVCSPLLMPKTRQNA